MEKVKPNFVHLVGLYSYCKMMHGAYNDKKAEISLETVELHSVLTRYSPEKDPKSLTKLGRRNFN